MADVHDVSRRGFFSVVLASLVPRAALAEDSSSVTAAGEPKPQPTPLSAPSTESPPPERDRTEASNYTAPIADSELVVCGAVIDVHAPLEDVKRVLAAFHRYKHILPRIQQSRVVAENAGTTDVYLRAPILHGLAAIWGVARFAPFAPWRKRGVQLVGSMVSGNLEKWSGKWMAFPCGERRTLLKLELFAELSMPIPTSVVTKWLLWACRKGVTAVRDMAECGTSHVAKD